MNNKTFQIIISGRVQGVGFRHFTSGVAEKLGLVGWVRNLSDGRVESLVRGPEKDVEKFAAQLKVGPRRGSVEKITFMPVICSEMWENFYVEVDGEELWSNRE